MEPSGQTLIPNIFVDEYLTKAKPEHLAVYLYGARHSPDIPPLKQIAQELKIRELDVVSAWTYWESAGLVRITDGSMEGFACEYLGIEKNTEIKTEVKDIPAVPAVQETEPQIKRIETQPNYTVAEIETAAASDMEIQYLFKLAERILSKPLTYNDMKMFLSFHDWLCLPVPVIEVLLDYCVSNNHRSGRYMEKVAMDWSDNEITTVEEAEAYIKLFNGDYREIMKSFGIGRRDPTPVETALMKKWLRVYKLPLDMITTACSQTVTNTGNISFPYADTVLSSWSSKGFANLEEALAGDEEFRKSRKEQEPKRPGRKSKFADYKGREWDYDKLEKLASEYAEETV